MSESKKSEAELLGEIGALQAELDTLRASESHDGTDGTNERAAAADGITRRLALAGWLAPVVLAIPFAGRRVSAKPPARSNPAQQRVPVPPPDPCGDRSPWGPEDPRQRVPVPGQDLIFEDDFECGDTSRWSRSVGELRWSRDE